jgi:hypothetical protein
MRFDRSAPSVNPPGLNLVTRTQLAQLHVSPATVVAWLADGSLEQVGARPNATSMGDAVYSVVSPKLLHELQLKQVEASPFDLAPWREAKVWQEPPSTPEVPADEADCVEEPEDVDEPEYVDESELSALVDSWEMSADAEAVAEAPLVTTEAASEPSTEIVMAAEQPEEGDPEESSYAASATAVEVDVDVALAGSPTEEPAFVDAAEASVAEPSEQEPSELAAADETPADAESAADWPTAEAPIEELAAADSTVALESDDSIPTTAATADPTAAEALDALFGPEPSVAQELTADEEVLADSVNEFTDDLAAGLVVETQAPSEVEAVQPSATHALDSMHFDEHIAELRSQVGGEAELEPIVTALRDGFAQTSRGLAETTACLQAIAKQLEERGPMRPVRVVMNGVATPNVIAAPPAKASGIGNAALITSTLLILGWAGVLWWKTGDLRLTIGAIAAANVLACCAVASARR